MQVSQMSDAVTHAVIGKKESVEMGVSDSAALMHIFSTTLYTYPRLATVREIICNGWDGHIVGKCTDKALTITVDERQVVIRDYGPGIPHEKIGPIYGVFGNSTKREDGSVTGGFGLGSKAPFSYTDNFEVVSHHAGVKSIYRVSKSSMEKGGKPSIDTIVQMPTEETGIRVTIPLKSSYDAEEFIRLIREVLILGEIHADLNGERVLVLPSSGSHTGYIINTFRGTLTQKINLRYGNVVYPIPRMDYYGEMWDQVTKNMQQLWDKANIIFIADPDTISIAPSREALIFTDATVETIKGLLAKFNPRQAVISKDVNRQVNATQVNKIIRESPAATNTTGLVTDVRLPEISGTVSNHAAGLWAYELRRAALHEMLSRRSLIYKGEELAIKRFHHALHTKPGMDKQLGKAFLKAARLYQAMQKGKIARNGNQPLPNLMNYALERYITGPLVRAVKAVECMNVDRLTYVHQPFDNSLTAIRFIYPWRQQINFPYQLFGYAFKRVLLARSAAAIKQFMDNQLYAQGDTSRTGWVVYQLPTSEKHYDTIKGVFEKLGYEVHTYLPKRAVVEHDGQAKPKVKAPKKVSLKRKGYLPLYAAKTENNRYLLSTARLKVQPDNPEQHVFDPVAYVVLASNSGSCHRFSKFSADMSYEVYKKWGKQIAVITSTQETKFIQKGIPEVSKFVYQHVDDTLSASADFRRYLAFGQFFSDKQRFKKETNKVLFGLCLHKELADSLPFSFRFGISAETASLICFYENMAQRNELCDLSKCSDLAAKVSKHPQAAILEKAIISSPWLEYLDLDSIGKALHEHVPGAKDLEIPYELTRQLLKEVKL